MKNYTFGSSRRVFIGGAAVAAAGSFYLAGVGLGVLKGCHQEDVGLALSDLQSIVRIGNSYLNEHESNVLEETLADEMDAKPAAIVAAVKRRLLAMDRQSRDEFARYDTVICDGWVLARSEARLCAAIAAALGAAYKV
jgi:hypothetical protein